jgi:hypothetical protein
MGSFEQLRLLYIPKISRPREVFDVVAGESGENGGDNC